MLHTPVNDNNVPLLFTSETPGALRSVTHSTLTADSEAVDWTGSADSVARSLLASHEVIAVATRV